MSRKDEIAPDGDRGDSKGAAQPARKGLVDHVEVVCEAVLGTGRLSIGELDRLSPGEAILLDASPADAAEVRVNGKMVARGEIVTIDGRFAIRITDVG